MGEGVEVPVRHRLEHRDLDLAAVAGARALVQCAEHAVGGIEAGDGIGDGRPDDPGVGRVHQQLQVAAGRLRHRVVARSRRRGAGGAEAADRAVDEARVEFAQPLLAHAQLLRHAGPEVLDVHVRRLHQLVQALAVGLLLGVERDAALVAVVGLEMRAVEAALEGAERVARARLLDLDDVGAQVAQHHAAGRPGDERALLEHAHAFQYFDHSLPPCAGTGLPS